MIKTNHALVIDNDYNIYCEEKNNWKLWFFWWKMESFDKSDKDCLLRELKEETGIVFDSDRVEFLYSDIQGEFHGNIFLLRLINKNEITRILLNNKAVSRKITELSQQDFIYPKLLGTIKKYCN